MKTAVPVYKCDEPDCKSTCTLTAAQEPNVLAELRKRGWAVLPPAPVTDDLVVNPDRHFCPAHAPAAK